MDRKERIIRADAGAVAVMDELLGYLLSPAEFAELGSTTAARRAWIVMLAHCYTVHRQQQAAKQYEKRLAAWEKLPSADESPGPGGMVNISLTRETLHELDQAVLSVMPTKMLVALGSMPAARRQFLAMNTGLCLGCWQHLPPDERRRVARMSLREAMSVLIEGGTRIYLQS